MSWAIFPLATEPVYYNSKLVAVVWTRVHLERELPVPRLSRYLDTAALVAVLAFLAFLFMSMHQRRAILRLKENLQLIERNPGHRLPDRTGKFGAIAEAINKMVDYLEIENKRRRKIEERLHQQEKMAALGKMLAGVAHEVKTPLAILKTRLQIWQRDLVRFERDTGHEPPLTGESLDIVNHEIDRMSDLVSKLLFFSRPVRQDILRSLDINDVIRNTVTLISPLFHKKSIKLELDLCDSDARILGDPDSLREVFLNLLNNSLDSADKGGRVSICSMVQPEFNQLVIDIMDTGAGVPPDLRDKVFEPFFSTRNDGTGLGLSIVYEIVHAHEGNIGFMEPEGQWGAVCRLTFPLIGQESEVT
jgi:signal transduction histidine kinase